MKKRNEEIYEMKKNRTKRLKMSALPYMRKLLNDENIRKTKYMKNESYKWIFFVVPVNFRQFDFFIVISITV